MARKTIVIIGLVAALLSGLAAAAWAQQPSRPGIVSTIDEAATAEEAAGLVFMREEEKLARDVYTVFAELWDQPIFERIARSEQAHTDAVLRMLDAYGIDDPTEGLAPGEFEDPGLQALYDDLVERGSVSLEAALEVGVLIEEVDIADLLEHRDETDSPEIIRVYENLLAGSERHLASFERVLAGEAGGAGAGSMGRGPSGRRGPAR